MLADNTIIITQNPYTPLFNLPPSKLIRNYFLGKFLLSFEQSFCTDQLCQLIYINSKCYPSYPLMLSFSSSLVNYPQFQHYFLAYHYFEVLTNPHCLQDFNPLVQLGSMNSGLSLSDYLSTSSWLSYPISGFFINFQLLEEV